jgi:uroporphyrinogen-III synthase
MSTRSGTPDFRGLRVLVLESRRSTEVAALIATYGGNSLLAPALREVPLESNAEALAFAGALIRGEIDIVIFLTGVGTRALVDSVQRAYSRADFLKALANTRIVARGPKPLAVLREMQVPIWVIVPEPNTWRETLAAIDARADDRPLRGAHVAVQEYGVSNDELLDGLAERGARVLQVRVYRWALPEDLTPLKRAVGAIADGQVDVIVFTTSVQVVHLWQVLQDMDADAAVRRGLASMLVASIGPTTSEELRRHQIDVDLEASHPRFGVLIRELAERSAPLLQAKRNRA